MRIKEYFLRGPRLGLHFMLTSRALACLSPKARERRADYGRAILPLPPKSLEPGFEAPNIKDPAGLAELVREAARGARGGGRDAALLLPETCQKSFVLGFEGFPPGAGERREWILWRLRKQMPSLPEDVRLSYDAASNGSPRRVFASLARSSIIREYESLFASCGFKLRMIGLPILGLLNLLDRQGERDVLLVNIEADAVSLLALLDGQPALYRLKPFLAGKDLVPDVLAAAVAREIAGTKRFLEDREKRAVAAVWVRAGAGGDPAELLAGLKAGLELPVRRLDAPPSSGFNQREGHFLGPLIGAAS